MAGLLLILLTLVPAKAQTIVYQGTKTTLDVVQVPGDSYKWELYNDANLNFAVVPGNCPSSAARFTGTSTGPSVEVEWILPGTYFYKVTARDALQCTNNVKIGMINVIPSGVHAVLTGMNIIGYCQQAVLDASGSGDDIISYEWTVIDQGGSITKKNDAKTEFLISSSFTGTLPSKFRVSLKVTNREGKSARDTISIEVNPKPAPEIYSSGQPEKDGSMMVDGSVSLGTGLSYKWSTTEGKIVGPIDKPEAHLLGAGMYSLEITDAFGCKAIKTFKFPIEQYRIIANPDYARTSWTEDTTVYVLSNDQSTAPLIPGSLRVITPPARGFIKINTDGSITYTPTQRGPGSDQFVYEICDAVNLCDSAVVTIIIKDIQVGISEGFSPNGDGQNDYLSFKGLENYPQSRLYVYTRSGQLVYQSSDYKNDWDGKMQSTVSSLKLVPTGVYYYVLQLGGTNTKIKGFIFVSY